MKQSKPIKRFRQPALDFLRGCAIFFMICTHVIVLHYQGTNPIIHFFSWWGGTVCFTIFLFVFSAVYGMKIAQQKVNLRKEIKRLLLMLVGYYLIAAWVHIFKAGNIHPETIQRINQIIRFELQPEYTEFIVAFMLYIIVTVIFYRLWQWFLSRPYLWALLIASVFIWSPIIESWNWGEGYINVIKSYLVGFNGLHSFPILPYFMVYGLGLWWGFNSQKQSFNSLYWGGISFIITATLWLGYRLSGHDEMLRWPPNVYFLLHGLLYIYGTLSLYHIAQYIPAIPKLIVFVGKHPFEYFLYHLIILMPFFSFGEIHAINGSATMLTFALTMAVCSYLIIIKPNPASLDA
ncbi:acyltransferase [candidate division WWE3 bacterium]|nr:acyltransferase [candidate division WWE3 bacterium]